MKLLREDSKLSSTRLALVVGMVIASMLGTAMTFNILYNTVNCDDINWLGQAAMLGTLTTFIASLLWGKVNQKKYEKPLGPISGVVNTIANNVKELSDKK